MDWIASIVGDVATSRFEKRDSRFDSKDSNDAMADGRWKMEGSIAIHDSVTGNDFFPL